MLYKAFVFDLGGTLMDYEGMPECWGDYYIQGFKHLKSLFKLQISDIDIETSAEMLKAFNPRIQYREIEYSPEYIFQEVTKHWNTKIDAIFYAEKFYKPLSLKAKIYEDTKCCLESFKSSGIKLAALTDLPTAMPDNVFRNDIKEILHYFDLYVSSVSCGYRKPNPIGLKHIAEHFKLKMKDILFIGDEEKDYEASLSAGCDFIWMDRKSLCSITDKKISKLEQLKELL